MTIRIPAVFYIVVLIIIAVLLFRYINHSPVPEVALYTVTGGTVETRVANTRVGTVKACRRSLLAPSIGGEVAMLNVTEGTAVSKGDVLLEIWNKDIRARLQLAMAQAEAADARIREACSIARGAQREAERLQKLLLEKMIPEDRVDQAQTEAEAKQASCDASRLSARVSRAQIALEESSLERTIVRAPYDGVIAEVNAELGGYVTPSPPGIPTLPAIDLLDLSCLYVSAPIDEVDAPPIRQGMQACVSLDAFPDKRCNGRVRRVSPYVLDVEKQARTVEVEVVLDDPADLQELLPGYSADIEIRLESHQARMRVPAAAVISGGLVLVFDEVSGKLLEREISTGIANWEFIEVLEGLQPGDRVYVAGEGQEIEPGTRIKPVAASILPD